MTISATESLLRLHPHQLGAIRDLQLRTDEPDFAGMLMLPTGGGKTLTAGYWLAQNFLDRRKKILWIAHRHELLNQAKQTFVEKLAFADVFKSRKSFDYRVISGVHDRVVNVQPSDDIVFASKDSLNANFDFLRDKWLTNEVLLVIDEAHHATAKTYRRLIENLRANCRKVQILGLTATPFRTAESEQGWLSQIFPSGIVYQIDLRTLIARGILSEPVFEEVKTNFNFAAAFKDDEFDRILEKIKNFDFDSLPRETARTIAENTTRNHAIVNRYTKNKTRYGQTLVFAVNRDNAIALNKLFRDAKIESDFVLSGVTGETRGDDVSSRENKEKIERFRAGEIEVLINVNILTEGTDLPKVQTVFLARPTISTILMTQMIGRGLRGEQAGGTKKAYIVSFIDDWQQKIAWVNPEQLFIGVNVDITDQQPKAREQFLRLISIGKIEEFTALAQQTLDNRAREQIENLDFIERIPLGIYQFTVTEPREKRCEILIYDNIRQSYVDFIASLPDFFALYELQNTDFLNEAELDDYAETVEDDFFHGCLKYPAFLRGDLENVLQFYANTATAPAFIEFAEREKFDLTKIARDIHLQDLRESEKSTFINHLWHDNANQWQAFFGYDERLFLNEIDLALRKIANPHLFQRVAPQTIQESRELEKLSMNELREQFPEFWKQLSDQVYAKFTAANGEYVSASGDYCSPSKFNFHIDHIQPISKGGLTVLENLQLLTRRENRRKGAK